MNVGQYTYIAFKIPDLEESLLEFLKENWVKESRVHDKMIGIKVLVQGIIVLVIPIYAL